MSKNKTIQHKRGTPSNWAKATNYIPPDGELIIYRDKGLPTQLKIGDGKTLVGDLPFSTMTQTQIEELVNNLIGEGGNGLSEAEIRALIEELATAAIAELPKNIEDGTGTGAIQQVADNVADGFDFTGKNPNAEKLDPSLSGIQPYGATGPFAASFNGKSSAQAKRSATMGTTNIAKGPNSVSMGDNCVTLETAPDSCAQGFRTVTGAPSANSRGNDTQALGEGSGTSGIGSITTENGKFGNAEGNYTKVNAFAGHGEGDRTEVHAVAGHSEGALTKVNAGADYGHTEGLGTEVNHMAQHAGGTYNKNYEDSLYEVGNGYVKDDETIVRSTAFRVLKDGRAKVQTAPQDDDDVVRLGDKDNIVISGLIENTKILADGEKTSACEWLGAVPKWEPDPSGYNTVIGMPSDGRLIRYRLTYGNPLGSSIACYATRGSGHNVLGTDTPVNSKDCTNKDYVDNLPDYLTLTDEQKAKWCEMVGAKEIVVVDILKMLGAYDGIQEVELYLSLSERAANGEIIIIGKLGGQYGVITGVEYQKDESGGDNHKANWSLSSPTWNYDYEGQKLDNVYLGVYCLMYEDGVLVFGQEEYPLKQQDDVLRKDDLTNTNLLSAEEKVAACETLGAVPKVAADLDNYRVVASVRNNGGYTGIVLATNSPRAYNFTIPTYMNDSSISSEPTASIPTKTPTTNYAAANKQYVDNLPDYLTLAESKQEKWRDMIGVLSLYRHKKELTDSHLHVSVYLWGVPNRLGDSQFTAWATLYGVYVDENGQARKILGEGGYGSLYYMDRNGEMKTIEAKEFSTYTVTKITDNYDIM